MTNKQLGTLALAGAPALLIGMYTEKVSPQFTDSWFTGLWGLVYISAWMCSHTVLYRIESAGRRFGKWLMRIMFVTLAIANISNVIQFLASADKPSFFFYLDVCWPLSNVLMLVLGITILVNKRVAGNLRFIPLGCGLWLPFTLVIFYLFSPTPLMNLISGLYSMTMWGLLAINVRNQPHPSVVERVSA
jgi:hypothetical protein